MVRENLSVFTSVDAVINSENAIFSFLVTVLTLKWKEKITDNFPLLNQVSTVVFTLRQLRNYV